MSRRDSGSRQNDLRSMGVEHSETHILAYARCRRPKSSFHRAAVRIRHLVCRAPCAVLGLLLLAPVPAMRYLCDPPWLPDWCDHLLVACALLLPGAIRRPRWQRFAAALPLAAAIALWECSGVYTRLSQSGYSPLTYWSLATIPVLAAATIAALTVAGKWQRHLLWLTIASVVVVSILEATTMIVQLVGLSVPRDSRVGASVSLNWLLYPALQIVLVWLVFPATLRVAENRQRVHVHMARLGATSAMAFVGFLVFSWYTVPALAIQSLSGHGPFISLLSRIRG